MTVAHGLTRRPPIEASEFAPIDRDMACVAGFFKHEADAQLAARQLQAVCGLSPSQLTLLCPTDASSARFAIQARRWTGGVSMGGEAWIGDRWIAAGVGGLLAIVAATAWLSFGDMDWALDAVGMAAMPVLAVLFGVAVGAALHALLHRQPSLRHFRNIVRRKLARGSWAVVAHGVPWVAQAGVLTLIRGSSLKWCAAVPAMQRL